jgi:hypothetical protein
MILLAPSANTSFGGLPVLLKLLARDNYLPHVFALKADRRVHRHGALALALVSAALLVFRAATPTPSYRSSPSASSSASPSRRSAWSGTGAQSEAHAGRARPCSTAPDSDRRATPP